MSEFYGEMDSDNSGNNHIFLFQYVGEQENSYIKIGVKTRIYNSSSEQLVAVIYTDYLTKLDRIFFFRREYKEDLLELLSKPEYRCWKYSYDNEITQEEISEINNRIKNLKLF